MAMTGGKAYLVKSEHPNYGQRTWTIDLYVYVKEASQSVVNNNTTLSLGMYVVTPGAAYNIGPWVKSSDSYIGTATSGDNCKIFDGAIPNFGGTRWLIENQQIVVPHNTDGTKTVRIYWKWGVNSPWGQYQNPSGYFDVTLTPIPRQATVTSATDFTDITSPTIKYTNPGGFRINARLEFAGVYINRLNIGNTGSYTFSLTEDEIKLLRSKCTSPSMTVREVIATCIGGTTENYWDWKDKTFSVTENDATKPTVTMTVSANNDLIPSGVRDPFNGLYIQGKSKVGVTLSATPKDNANITGYSTEIDGKRKTYKLTDSQPFISDVIQSKGSLNIVGKATDSRNITGSATETITVIEYSKPTVNPVSGENAIHCYRSDDIGTPKSSGTKLWVKAKRNYYKVMSDGIQKNFCKLQCKYKSNIGGWSSWVTLIDTSSESDEYNALVPGATFDVDKSYTVQFQVIDTIGESDIKTFEIPTQDCPLHLGEGGKNVAIGGYCDYSKPESFQVNWDTYIEGDTYINGEKIIPNIFYQASGEVDAVQGQLVEVCSLDITGKGNYLLLGTVDASVADSNSLVIASFLTLDFGVATIYGRSSKTTMASGGGTTTYALLSLTGKEANIKLASYGYSSQTYKLRGNMLAIRLG